MKPRWGILAIVIPACLAILAASAAGQSATSTNEVTATPAATATSTPTPDPCQWAQYYVDNDLYDLSRQRYQQLLEATPGLECAVAGLSTVEAILTCQPAAAYLREGTFDAAADAFSTIVATAPDMACANKGLAAAFIAQTPTPEPTASPAPSPTPTKEPTSTPDFRPVEGMDERGDSGPAATALAGILANDPYATVPASLSHLDNNPFNDLSFGLPFVDLNGQNQWTGFPGWDMTDQLMDSMEDFLTSWSWLPILGILVAAYLAINAYQNRHVLRWRYLHFLCRRPLVLGRLLFRNPVRVTIKPFTVPGSANTSPGSAGSPAPNKDTGGTSEPNAAANGENSTAATQSGGFLTLIFRTIPSWISGFLNVVFARLKDLLGTSSSSSLSKDPPQSPETIPAPDDTETTSAPPGASLVPQDLGTIMSTFIQEHYVQIGKTSNRVAPKMLLTASSASTAGATVIGLAAGVVKGTNFISAAVSTIVSFLNVKQEWELHGRLVNATTKEIRVDIQLIAGNTIVNSVQISVEDAGTLPDAYSKGAPSAKDIESAFLSVSEDIAIWLFDQLKTERQIRGWSTRDHTEPHIEWENWESYSAFRQGVVAMRNGQPEDSVRHFDRSLSRDSLFLPARINRQSVKTEIVAKSHAMDPRQKAQAYQGIYQSWHGLLGELKRVRLSVGRKLWLFVRDQQLREWYVIQFNMAAAGHYSALPTDAALHTGMESTECKPDSATNILTKSKDSTRVLRRYIVNSDATIFNMFRQPSLLLDHTLKLQLQIAGCDQLGSCTKWKSASPGQKVDEILRQVEQILDEKHLRNPDNFGFSYGMACLYATACLAEDPKESYRINWSDSALNHLDRALEIAASPRARQWPRSDPSLATLRCSSIPEVKQRFDQIVAAD